MTTLLALFAFFTIPSFAETPACHSLDFDSYFVAQQAKSNLQKMNDLQHPNFARNFLLVKNAMMMETLYLIADCRTGKFLHEKISGEAKFTLDSNEVLLSNLKTQKIEKMICWKRLMNNL